MLFFSGEKMIKSLTGYFTKFEAALWLFSALLVTAAYCVFDRSDPLTLAASLIGVTYLILNAKGNPIGQALVIIFSVLYGIISFRFRYYGEMITYIGMTLPMAVAALISWLKNPYNGKKAEVRVSRIGKKETAVMIVLTAGVTVIFYFILKAFGTARVIPSSLSVTTSFLAVYLTCRRDPYFAAAYALNDMVLIVLWSLASAEDIKYVSVLVCFIVFLANDIYGFISWMRMKKRQDAGK